MSGGFTRTMEALAEGPHVPGITGAQLYAAVGGQQEVNVAVGHACEGRPMQPGTLLRWLCCSKPLTLLAAIGLLADHDIAVTSRVGSVLPEYGRAGKQEVTFEHLLTHTVPYQSWGVRYLGPDTGPTADDVVLYHLPAQEAFLRICAEPLSAAPGSQVVYTSHASWHVLAELIRRLTGRPFDEVVKERVMAPLGMESSWPVTDRSIHARHEPRFGYMYHCRGNVARLEPFEKKPFLVTERSAGSSARGTARDLAAPMQCILNDGAGKHGRVISADLARALTRHRRLGLPDGMFGGFDAAWGWGLCTDPLVFGLPPDTCVVGHTGYRSSFTFADLDRRVVVSYIANSRYNSTVDRPRKWKVVKALYQDLGLAGADSFGPPRQLWQPR
jgi:CubicO group peptidase (beta-lactamase class C family)